MQDIEKLLEEMNPDEAISRVMGDMDDDFDLGDDLDLDPEDKFPSFKKDDKKGGKKGDTDEESDDDKSGTVSVSFKCSADCAETIAKFLTVASDLGSQGSSREITVFIDGDGDHKITDVKVDGSVLKEWMKDNSPGFEYSTKSGKPIKV